MRAFWKSIFIHQSRIVLSSALALSFYIAWIFLLVSAALLQYTYSKIEKHMRGQRMRQKIANREGWASSVKPLVMGRGVMYAGQVVKIECLKVKFECSKVRFEWLKLERSEEYSTSRGYASQRMHSKGMYLGLQSTRIFESKFRVFRIQVRVVEGAEERSTSRGYPSQRMHSEGMYLDWQGTRILVGFWWVSAASSARSEHARGWSHGYMSCCGVSRTQGECPCGAVAPAS